MVATVTLLGSNQEASKVIAESSTVIQIPWMVVSLIAIYFIGLWVCLFLDGMIDDKITTNDEGGWVVALMWPLALLLIATMGLGILIKYLCKKIPKTIKNFFFYCSLPFRPIKAGELLSNKLTKDGRITSLRRS
jgi:hypothetical protein